MIDDSELGSEITPCMLRVLLFLDSILLQKVQLTEYEADGIAPAAILAPSAHAMHLCRGLS